ncbi:unnamed protein product, partial [Prorocentrum cordatum]
MSDAAPQSPAVDLSSNVEHPSASSAQTDMTKFDLDDLLQHEASTIMDSAKGSMDTLESILADKMRALSTTPIAGPSAPSAAAADEPDGNADAIWTTLKDNNFDFKARAEKGNSFANKFADYLKTNPADAATYKSMKKVGRDAQAKMRRDWAKGEYQIFVEEKLERKVLSTKSFSKAKYRSLGSIAEAEGFLATPKRAMQSAINYALQCVVLGFPWYKHDGWVREEGFEDSFTREWEEKKTRWKDTPIVQDGGGSAADSGGSAVGGHPAAPGGDAGADASAGGAQAGPSAGAAGSSGSAAGGLEAIGKGIVHTKAGVALAAAEVPADDELHPADGPGVKRGGEDLEPLVVDKKEKKVKLMPPESLWKITKGSYGLALATSTMLRQDIERDM